MRLMEVEECGLLRDEAPAGWKSVVLRPNPMPEGIKSSAMPLTPKLTDNVEYK